MALDNYGNPIIAGSTTGSYITTTGAAQTTFGGGLSDGFISKFNSAITSLTFSSYDGGASEDVARGVAVDPYGKSAITGYTSSANFPLASPSQGSFGGGTYDAFVSFFNATGTSRVLSTYFGSTGSDQAWGISKYDGGGAYIVGQTTSTLSGTLIGTRGGTDAFMARVGAGAHTTTIAGTGNDYGYAISAGSAGVAIAGQTTSSDFPTTSPIQGSLNGSSDAFAGRLNLAGTSFAVATYLGGSSSDQANAVAMACRRTSVWPARPPRRTSRPPAGPTKRPWPAGRMHSR